MLKKKLEWDTTTNLDEYPSEIKKNFYKFYYGERKNFVLWLDKISSNYSEDIDWWLSPPASRNLYLSDIYKYFCVLKTLDELKNKYIFEVITDSQAFKKILIKSFRPKILNVKIKLSKKIFSKYFYFFYILKNIILFFIQFLLVKILSEKNHIPDNVTLIDTFLIDKKKKEKFYYGNLLKYAKKKNKKIIFVATIIENNVFKFLDILLKIKNNKDYLFKENYINFNELLYYFSYPYRLKKFKKSFKKLNRFQLSALIQEEIFYNRNLFSVFLGMSNFSFFKNLHLKSIKIRKVINWFENQPMDKGFNYGLRKFFPSTLSLGYQGFTNYPEYMNTCPSITEFKSKVIPKQIIICGNVYKKLRKEFCNDLQIINGPALRAEKIFHFFKKKYIYDIVIFLEGGSKTKDADIISKFINISQKFKDLKFFIKTHPILPLKKLDIKIPNNFEVLNDDFSSIAKKTFIAVSYGNTSAILESLSYGCNLIVPYDNILDKKNLSTFKIKKNFFKVCDNNFEIINAINFFVSTKNSQRLKNRDKIKNIFFNKISKKTLSIFF